MAFGIASRTLFLSIKGGSIILILTLIPSKKLKPLTEIFWNLPIPLISQVGFHLLLISNSLTSIFKGNTSLY